MAHNIPTIIHFILAQIDVSFDWLKNLNLRFFLLLHRLFLLFLLHLLLNILNLNHCLGCLTVVTIADGVQCFLDLFWLLYDLDQLLFA